VIECVVFGFACCFISGEWRDCHYPIIHNGHAPETTLNDVCCLVAKCVKRGSPIKKIGSDAASLAQPDTCQMPTDMTLDLDSCISPPTEVSQKPRPHLTCLCPLRSNVQ
jgi:hypothetical protein